MLYNKLKKGDILREGDLVARYGKLVPTFYVGKPVINGLFFRPVPNNIVFKSVEGVPLETIVEVMNELKDAMHSKSALEKSMAISYMKGVLNEIR